MSREEYEAIDSVVNFLMEEAAEAALKLGHDNEMTLGKASFYINSYRKYLVFWKSATIEYNKTRGYE